ncbi:MAG: cold shock domain-containing protein [Nitratireductor sp.]
MEETDIAYGKCSAIAEEALKHLDKIRSEEDTKIRIINRMLTECLGWAFADVAAETAHENGYSDYLISNNGKGALLVEAKRIGALEITTAEKNKVRHFKLAGPALAKSMSGIDQAARYSMPNGLPISVLTDGIAWIVFKTFVQGENFKSKEAIVFPSLEAVLNDFLLFFELLAKSSFERKLYNRIFDQVHQPRLAVSRTLFAALPPDEIKINQKSDIASALDRIFALFFSRLTGDQDEDMLIDCFVESRESRFADYALEKMTASVLGNLSPVDRDVDEELSTFIEAIVEIDPDQQDSGQSVFIVGPTGAGKSTFLARFFKRTLSNALRKRCIVTRVNCLDSSGRTDTLLSSITETLIRSLERNLYPSGHPTFFDLQGLYHSEYIRRAEGSDAQLYSRDKGAFKEKFGEYLNKAVQEDRESYLKRLLTDVVHNRKQLPILLFDNIDEFTIEFKTVIFQFAQSLRRHAQHCLLIFPLTDKSAWSFSKTDIFGIYQSRSFFLPTPSPREVLRKRIDFLKSRLAEVKDDPTGGTYFTARGIKISIPNLEAVAKVLENVFVDQENTAQILGEITNYNIRRTLALSRRIITSPVLQIEDILNSYITGADVTTSFSKFMNALLKGDWESYKRGDQHEVFPIFDVDADVRQSPLLALRILALLQSIAQASRTLDQRHLSVQSILDYFDALGGYETAIDRCMLRLLEGGLIEPYDSSVRDLAPAQKLAISASGAAHFRLATCNEVFCEQMAITTPIGNPEIVARIKALNSGNGPILDRLYQIRHEFITYLIDEDRKHLSDDIASPQYESQRQLVDLLRQLGRDPKEQVVGRNTPANGPTMLSEGTLATVDWFDAEKGYGFVDAEGFEGKAFLHAEKLSEAGIESVADGDEILCDIGRNSKGIHVLKVHDIQTDPASVQVTECSITRLFPDRNYGFVRLLDTEKDAFFHYSVVPEAERDKLTVMRRLKVNLGPDRTGRGLQVRAITEFLE